MQGKNIGSPKLPTPMSLTNSNRARGDIEPGAAFMLILLRDSRTMAPTGRVQYGSVRQVQNWFMSSRQWSSLTLPAHAQ